MIPVEVNRRCTKILRARARTSGGSARMDVTLAYGEERSERKEERRGGKNKQRERRTYRMSNGKQSHDRYTRRSKPSQLVLLHLPSLSGKRLGGCRGFVGIKSGQADASKLEEGAPQNRFQVPRALTPHFECPTRQLPLRCTTRYHASHRQLQRQSRTR